MHSITISAANGRATTVPRFFRRGCRSTPPYIVTLLKGYDSGVGEAGKWLSEGQKQRIALARAILPNPAILLLDEVTSALDPESEAGVNATIQRLAKRRTVILVTHRLASVMFVDRLVAIDQGQVKEQGRHEELLAQPGCITDFGRCKAAL